MCDSYENWSRHRSVRTPNREGTVVCSTCLKKVGPGAAVGSFNKKRSESLFGSNEDIRKRLNGRFNLGPDNREFKRVKAKLPKTRRYCPHCSFPLDG